jgi:hypothetical protein
MKRKGNISEPVQIAVPLSFLASIIGVAIGFVLLLLNKRAPLAAHLPKATQGAIYSVDVVFIAWFFVARHQLRVIFADSLIQNPDGVRIAMIKTLIWLFTVVSIAGSLLLTILGIHLFYGALAIVIVGTFYFVLWIFLLIQFKERSRRAAAVAALFSEFLFISFWIYVAVDLFRNPQPDTSGLMPLVVVTTLVTAYEVSQLYWNPLLARLAVCIRFFRNETD